jgi:hypothetical protein
MGRPRRDRGTDGEIHVSPTFPGLSEFAQLSSTTDPGLQAQPPTVISQGLDQVASSAKKVPSNHTHVIPRAIGYASHWGRGQTDLENALATVSLAEDALPDMVPRTAMLGTPKQQLGNTGRDCVSTTIIMPKNAASFQDSRPPSDTTPCHCSS